jgi:maltose/moltooligosaccharide transporter
MTQKAQRFKNFQKRFKKVPLGFAQLWNMSFGFFGIQFGWTLQMANTSAIYEYLGANPEQIPLLWLAAPLSGLIVQPIIGYMSDRTWTRLGRRRPYFLFGAILSSIALVIMPNSSSLWMAAGALWILDTSVNISMEPFRAFVSDLVPENQRTLGFGMQAFFIGLGAVIASICPWILNHWFHLNQVNTASGEIPLTVKVSYYIGAAVFLGTVLWTVFTTKEYPPQEGELQRRRQNDTGGIAGLFKGIFDKVRNMPSLMRQLAWVQFFTWLGIFCVFLYFPPAVGHEIFGATEESSPLYQRGVEWAGICIAIYNIVCFVYSLFLSRIAAATSRKTTHGFSLLCGGLGLVSLLLVDNQYLLILPMACFGLAWASALTMPYSMLSDVLPMKDTGIYMGVFNAFIVIPQVIAALGLGWVMENLLGNNRIVALAVGGVSMVIAAVLVQWVQDVAKDEQTTGKTPKPRFAAEGSESAN